MPRRLTTSWLRTRTPPAATAPMPNSGWSGAPSLRETNTSSGAPREREISYPTGTPPLGKAKTTGRSSIKRDSFSASRRPASLRSSNGGKPKILMASAEAPPVWRQGLAALLDLPHSARVFPAGGFLPHPPNGRGDALGEGLEIVASLEDERGRRCPNLAGEVGDQGGEACERVAPERHAPEQVVCVGVETGGDQDHLGPELPQQGQEVPGESRRVEVLPRASRQRHVGRKAQPLSSPHFVGLACSRVEGALVRRDVEHPTFTVKNLLGTGSMLHAYTPP